MNFPFFSSSIWSMSDELKITLLVMIIMLLLPILAVLLLTNVGINIVSDELVHQTLQRNGVTVRDPKDGSVIAEVDSPMHWPITGVVTLEFGAVDLPYQPLHTGIDIANTFDTPVTPFMDGVVVYAGEISWGYGKYIILDNGNHISSLYGHLDRIYVYPGEKVTIDQVIGAEGQTGWATGPHLHFETRVFDIPVNPRTFLSGNP